MSMNKITKGYPNWDVPYNENVDEYNNTIGNEELVTTSKTIKGAINEIHNVADDVTTINADISNLKTSVAQNTSQLNEKANKENSEFTGTMKLNDSNVVTEKTAFKHYAVIANPNNESFVDVSLPDIINNFVVAQNGNINITKLYVIGTYFDPDTKNTRIELNETYTGVMQFNIIYK